MFLAEIAYLMEIFAVDKAAASLTNTYYFVAYAGVQVILFFIVKRINLQKFLAITVPIAAFATVAMGLSRGIGDMYLLFAVCGVFQAGVYCGCNATLTAYLPSRYLARANSVMNLGYASGTVVAYVFSAFCIKFDAWRLPFFVMGTLLLASVIFFWICVKCASRLKNGKREAKSSSGETQEPEQTPFITLDGKRSKAVFYAADLILVFLITCLYYAINNWISTLLVDVYSMSQDVSIYITILAPTLIAVGPALTIRYCEHHRDFIRAGVLYLAVAMPVPLILAFFYDVNLIFAFVLSVFYIIAVNGVKSIALSIMAFKLRDVVNTAEYTAISNATASLAGGVAPTVVGKIIDSHGWSVSYFVVFGVTLFVVATLMVIDVFIRKNDKSKQRLT